MTNKTDLRAYVYNGFDNPISAHTFAIETGDSVGGVIPYKFCHTDGTDRKHWIIPLHEGFLLHLQDIDTYIDTTVDKAIDHLGVKDGVFKNAVEGDVFTAELKRFLCNRLRTMLSEDFPKAMWDRGTVGT